MQLAAREAGLALLELEEKRRQK
jgi:hypothetical protein